MDDSVKPLNCEFDLRHSVSSCCCCLVPQSTEARCENNRKLFDEADHIDLMLMKETESRSDPSYYFMNGGVLSEGFF